MTRLTALLLILALWAGIYLPGLGSTELKGEEGRRIMPAVTMLEDGDWVVPHVGGEQYLRKPPMVQWCIAVSLKLFGNNTWAARLPSALGMLALAAVILVATRGWLITEQSFLAAVMVITQVAMVDKCRLAEMEGIYVVFSGIGLVLWMGWWARERSPWLVWTVPMVFNALAFLAKGPLHLLFFYAVVLGALLAAREWRQLWSLPHLTGLALMAGLVALWAVPYYARVDHEQLARTLQHQAVDRFTGADASLGKWLANLPSGIGDHLPWILFAPMLWRLPATGLHERTVALLRGGRWAVALTFVVLLLIPGVLPRYVLPLSTPYGLLLAVVLWDCPRRVRHWWRYTVFGLTFLVFAGAVASPFLVAGAVADGDDALNPAVAAACLLPIFSGALLLMGLRRRLHETLHLTLWTGLVMVMAMALFAICAVPRMKSKEDLRPFAQQIDASVPEQKPVIAYSMGDYAPLLGVLFYLEHPYQYAADDKSAPDSGYFLMRGKDRKKFEDKFRILGEPVAMMPGRDDEKPAVVVKAERKKQERPARANESAGHP